MYPILSQTSRSGRSGISDSDKLRSFRHHSQIQSLIPCIGTYAKKVKHLQSGLTSQKYSNPHPLRPSQMFQHLFEHLSRSVQTFDIGSLKYVLG